MPYMYYSPDSMWTYVLIVLPAVLIALWASANVNSTFKKYAQIPSTSGFTGADAARRILDANGLTHIRIEHVNGKLTDHYDPKAEVIRLSDSVYDNRSAAPSVLRAHEAGTRGAARPRVFPACGTQRHYSGLQHWFESCDAAHPFRLGTRCIRTLHHRDTCVFAFNGLSAHHAAGGIQCQQPCAGGTRIQRTVYRRRSVECQKDASCGSTYVCGGISGLACQSAAFDHLSERAQTARLEESRGSKPSASLQNRLR